MIMEIPAVNELPPDNARPYKFVQFEVNGNPYMRTAQQPSYHTDIVAEFCREIECKPYEDNRKIYPRDPAVTLVGAGFIYKGGNVYYYGGRSASYRITPDNTHMEKIAALFPENRFVFDEFVELR